MKRGPSSADETGSYFERRVEEFARERLKEKDRKMIVKGLFVLFGLIASAFGMWLVIAVMQKLGAFNVQVVELEALLLFLIGVVFLVRAAIMDAIKKAK